MRHKLLRENKMIEEGRHDAVKNVMVKEEILLPNVTIKEEKDGEAVLLETGEVKTNHLVQNISLEFSGSDTDNEILEQGEVSDGNETLEPGEVPGEIREKKFKVKQEISNFTEKRKPQEVTTQETKDCYVNLHRGWDKTEMANCRKCRGNILNQEYLYSTAEPIADRITSRPTRRRNLDLSNNTNNNRPHKNTSKSIGKKTISTRKRKYLKERRERLETHFECDFCKYRCKTKSDLTKHILRIHLKIMHKCYLCKSEFKTQDELKQHRILCINNKPFECKVCGASFTANFHLTAHMKWHKEKPFKCEICSKAFITNSFLVRHSKAHRNKEKKIKCNLCDFRAVYKKELLSHVRTVHADIVLKCKTCDKSFSRHIDFTVHQGTHTGEKPPEDIYVCDICQKGFIEKWKLIRHNKTHEKEKLKALQKPYQCNICQSHFFSKYSLEYHIFQIHFNMMYKCNICQSKFDTKNALNLHKSKCKTNIIYKCEECGADFETKPKLTNHKKKHNGEKLFRCEVCNKTFIESQSLENHRCEKLIPFKCKSCDYSTNFKSIFKSHIKTVHKENLHNCNLCDKSFDRESRLRRHLNVHTGEKPYSCDECGKKFTTEFGLKSHLKKHKKKKNSYECNECHRIFYYKFGLAVHVLKCLKRNLTLEKSLGYMNDFMGHFLRTENGKDIFRCNLCDYTTNEQKYIRKHVRVVHHKETRYECNECKKRFFSKSKLGNHIRLHTKEKPFKCDMCDHAFREKVQLTKHMKVHTDEKPYECDVCKKTFKRKGCLRLHVQIHTGLKPFECEFCRENFRLANELKLHKKKCHEGKPFQCDLCKKGFKDKKELKRHFRINKVEYKCKKCGKRYHKNTSYRHHLWRCQNRQVFKVKPFKCDLCTARFKNESELKRHKIKNNIEYECECGKRYHIVATYKQHIWRCRQKKH